MNIAPQDLLVFVGFFVLVLGLSVWKSRKVKGHEEDSSDFFLAGRGLTWPLIGISIVKMKTDVAHFAGVAQGLKYVNKCGSFFVSSAVIKVETRIGMH